MLQLPLTDLIPVTTVPAALAKISALVRVFCVAEPKSASHSFSYEESVKLRLSMFVAPKKIALSIISPALSIDFVCTIILFDTSYLSKFLLLHGQCHL